MSLSVYVYIYLLLNLTIFSFSNSEKRFFEYSTDFTITDSQDEQNGTNPPNSKPLVLKFDGIGLPSVQTSVTVKNTGSMAGDEVVFLYINSSNTVHTDDPMAIKQLVDYERVTLNPGESQVRTLCLLAATICM
jgi:hypothetical protein